MATLTTSHKDPDNKRSGVKGCLWTIGVVFMVLLLVGASLLTFWAVRESSDRKLVEAKLDEIRRSGLPTDIESLTAAYEAKTDLTDAPAWNQIFAELQSSEFRSWSRGIELFDGKAENTGWTETSWPGEAAERNLIAKTEDMRGRIHQLVRKPTAVRFLSGFKFNMLIPHAQYQREVGRLISTEFQVAFADRDSKACREAIETLLGVALLSREDPLLVCQLVNVACHHMAMGRVQLALEHDILSEPDIEAISEVMSNYQPALQRLVWAMQCDKIIGLDVSRNPSKLRESFGESEFVALRVSNLFHRNSLHLLEFFEGFENLDVSDIDHLQKEATRLSNDFQTKVQNANIFEQKDWVLTSLVAPAISSAIEAMIRDEVLERFIRHGLAIRLYEKRYGRLPASLDELREVDFDYSKWKPWGGKPFGYRVEEGDGILWATIPKDGTKTSDQPPAIDSETGDTEMRKMFFLRIRRVAK